MDRWTLEVVAISLVEKQTKMHLTIFIVIFVRIEHVKLNRVYPKGF